MVMKSLSRIGGACDRGAICRRSFRWLFLRHSASRRRRVAAAAASLAICLLAVPSGAKVLLRVGARKITVGAVTLVPYADAVRKLGVLGASVAALKSQSPRHAGYGPAAPGWDPRGNGSLPAYYRHLLDGVILNYVAGDVARQFLRLHPPSGRYAFHRRVFQHAVLATARLSQLGVAVLADAVMSKPSKQIFLARLRRVFPTNWRSAAYLWQAVGFLSKHAPFFVMAESATPYYIGHRAAPWFNDRCLAAALLPVLHDYVREHRRRFIALLNRQMGSRAFYLVSFAGRDAAGALVELFRSAAGRRGGGQPRFLRRVSRTLGLLGSPTAFYRGSTSYLVLHDRLGVPWGKLRPFRPITLPWPGRGGRRHASRQYLYIVQRSPNAAKVSHSTAPGGFLFELAAHALLKPIFVRTLAHMRPGAGLRLPTASAVVDCFYAPWPFPKRVYGVPIPQPIGR